MGNKKKDILNEAVQAVVMSMGREKNAIEFYTYLSETVPISKARNFFKDMVKRETDDLEELETFLTKLKRETEGAQEK